MSSSSHTLRIHDEVVSRIHIASISVGVFKNFVSELLRGLNIWGRCRRLWLDVVDGADWIYSGHLHRWLDVVDGADWICSGHLHRCWAGQFLGWWHDGAESPTGRTIETCRGVPKEETCPKGATKQISRQKYLRPGRRPKLKLILSHENRLSLNWIKAWVPFT